MIYFLYIFMALTVGQMFLASFEKRRADRLLDENIKLLKERKALYDKIDHLLSLPSAPLDADATGDPDPDYVDPWDGYEHAAYCNDPAYQATVYPWRQFCWQWSEIGRVAAQDAAKAAHEAAIGAFLERRGTKGRSE